MEGDARGQLDHVAELLGIDTPSDDDVLSWAPPDLRSVADTYRFVNGDLVNLLNERKISRVDHITRVGRVLLDSTHRQVLLRAAEEANISPTLCYRDSARGAAYPTVWSFLASCRPSWLGLSWLELVDILFVLGSRAVELIATDRAMPVQFSVFGDDRVLLQSPTERPTPEKYVWYVRSRSINEALARTQEAFRASGQAIDAASANRVRRWLLDYDLHQWANEVLSKGRVIGSNDAEAIADWRLEMLGLWSADPADPSRRQLTPMGEQWVPGIRPEGAEGGTHS